MSNSLPLEGIKVIEMTEALAGPYSSMLLGDLGADVIKIERPEIGDQSRGWGPPFLQGESAYFLSTNRNKRSLELDIKSNDDIELFYRLIKDSDVFITNNPKMDSLKKNNIDPDLLRKMNPKLIYVAISGYGHSGLKAGRPGYDILAQGEAGLMSLTGSKESSPARYPSAMADISAGIYATIGILSSLYKRDCNKKLNGDFIDIALVDAQTTWLANIGSSFFMDNKRPARMGNAHPTICPYQPLKAKDKMLIIAIGTERLWKKFCRILQITESVMNDPKFITNAKRNDNRHDLIKILEKIMVKKNADYWIEQFINEDIPAGPINFPDETLEDAHLKSRNMIVEIEHPALGIIKSIGNPINISQNGPTYRRHPPQLGEHNEEIRKKYSKD
ncbi:MAG: CoA transferase [Pseudomonadota bacterium]|nr:formyl-CoA transferase [Gammaproteobacteria bacterium]MEE2684654.1 CoA transferase [Pseudomonadota bacterium]